MSNEEYNREATDLIHLSITTSLNRIEEKVDSVDRKVEYTNGKVKRITLALVALSGFSAGLGILQVSDFIKIIL